MDLYVATEEFGLLARGYSRDDAQRVGLLTMAHEDCNTVPFLWKYAHSFALFDHFFQAMTGPSTPGNLELVAAQTGQTQWAKDATEQVAPNGNGAGVPVVNDSEPANGPYPGGVKPDDTQYDQKYATVLLTLSGAQAKNAKNDSDMIREDVAALERGGHASVPWGWYQEGYADAKKSGSGYVMHHNAVQYFGYLRNNPYYWRGVHDLRDLLPAISAGSLGDRSVIFVKGGSSNPFGWKPGDKSPYVQLHFAGDDDHPGYADSQLSESLVATVVNAIARSKYWNDSAILLTWDDSEGFYDHVSPPNFERCPDGHPCGDGPRVPAILISPYAKSTAIVPDVSDQTSLPRFLATLFDLPPLATLPDEAPYMPEGPRDTDPALSDLTGAFDPARLDGSKAPIPASDAQIPDDVVTSFPVKMSCSSLGITPVRLPGGDTPPAGFSPLLLEH
jgi:phospholipase C